MTVRRFYQLTSCELEALRELSWKLLDSKDDSLQTLLHRFEFRRERLSQAIQEEENEQDPTLRVEKTAARVKAESEFEELAVPRSALRQLQQLR